MSESNIYIPLWRKYKPAILNMMKEAVTTPQLYSLSAHEFKAIGERTSSGYSFNLEIKEGTVINNVDGTAVARDLLNVLKNSTSAKKLMSFNYFKITMSSNFELKIQIIK